MSVCRRNANTADMQVPLRQLRMPTRQRQPLAMQIMLAVLLHAVHSEQKHVSRLRRVVEQRNVAGQLVLARRLDVARLDVDDELGT